MFFFQIKEGAENLRKVAKDKKSVSDVNHIVKKSNTKLCELQAELQELDSQLLVTQGMGNLPNSPLAGIMKIDNYLVDQKLVLPCEHMLMYCRKFATAFEPSVVL